MSIKDDKLREIRDELIAFKESPLYSYRVENKYFPVVGEGNHDADIMFIGEAPGENEAKTARPFCGASGRILGELLEHIGLKREDVYITNIVKDRPPANRDPKPDEIALYAPFLDRQIDIIQPKVIATLGRFSMQYIFEHLGIKDQLGPISKMHGTTSTATTSYGTVQLMPLYHPAVALYNGSMKEILKKDFEVLKEFVGE